MKITATGNGPSPSGRTTNVVMSPSAVPTRISFSIISSSLTVADAIVQMDHAVLEAAFVHQLEVHAQIVGQGLVAASHHDGRHESVEFVDQAGLDRLRGQVGTADCDVTFGLRFHLPDRFGVEVSLDAGPGCGSRLQRP